MKLFTRPLIEGKWKVYVTDDDYDTYTTIVDKEEPPSDDEVQKLFNKNRGDFREVY
tara:strand:- start:83 stop:250 length:168 start_codon:yes stop_codon:yes gene_type:complete